jgi:uncharacterized protein (DUF342 family)
MEPPRVLIEISDDGMEAFASFLLPVKHPREDLEQPEIHAALEEAGVTSGIDPDALAALVKLFDQTRWSTAPGSTDSVLIAKGIPPKKHSIDRLERIVHADQLVRPGAMIATFSPPPEETLGTDVRGRFIDPENPIPWAAADGVRFDPDEGAFFAEQPGYLQYRNHSITLASPIEVSEDNLTATLRLENPAEDWPTPEEIFDHLDALGIRHGIQRGRIISNLAAEAPRPLMIIVEGTPVTHGKAGELVFTYEMTQAIGVELPDGTMDYHERNLITPVTAGEVLAIRYPPVQGENGKDIFGTILPAEVEPAPELIAGDNVTLENNQYLADIDGAATHKKDTLQVTDLVTLKGDIDFHTGNIRHLGSLMIPGMIRSTFVVEAAGDIDVRNGIESARVLADGDVTVHAGIFHHPDPKMEDAPGTMSRFRTDADGNPIQVPDHSIVSAGGNISAQSVLNAYLEALQDILIHNEAINSEIHAGNRFYAVDGRGTVIGGIVTAGYGIRVVQAGNETETPTRLSIYHHRAGIQKLENIDRELRELEENIATFRDSAESMQEAPRERQDTAVFRKIQAAYRQLKKRQGELLEIRSALADDLRERSAAEIIVTGTVYPRVRISINGAVFIVDRALHHVRFFWNAEEERIDVSSPRDH